MKILSHTLFVLTLLLSCDLVYADTALNLLQKIRLISHSSVDVNYHWVSVQGGVKESDNSTVNTACAGALYFPAADKEMAAVALSAQVNGLQVNYTYDDAADPVFFNTQGTLSCRLISLFINGYQ